MIIPEKRKISLLLLAVAVLYGTGSPAKDIQAEQKKSNDRVHVNDSVRPESAAGTNSNKAASTRLQPADLDYQGAFRLPAEFNWGAQGLAYYPLGDTGKGALLVTGHDQRTVESAEVSIPAPATSTNWLELPVAVILRPLTEFDGNLVETQLDTTTSWAGGSGGS